MNAAGLRLCALLAACACTAAPSAPTWNRDVAPIILGNCSECHQPGGSAPFSLITYEQVSRKAELIRQLTEERIMPPWLPAGPKGAFIGERGLSAEQISILADWHETGAAEGPGIRPPAAPPPLPSKWPLGEPDVIVRMPAPYQVPGGPGDVYRAFPISLPSAAIPEAVRKAALIPETDLLGVSAVDIHPGNWHVLHHAHVWADTTGQARRLEKAPGSGYEAFGGPGFPPAAYLGGIVPGTAPRRLPDGIAEALPLGADLVLQIHYSPSGKPESDQTEVGLYFTREPVKRTVEWLRLGSFNLEIPAGEPSHAVTDELVIPADCFVLSVSPHMHYLGREVSARAILPDGSVRELLSMPRWDFRWQDRYAFRDPVPLPAGTRVEARWIYDNSGGNPHNPNSPPKHVHFGPNTTDEMCELHLFVVPWAISDYPKFGEIMQRRMAEKIGELTPEQRLRYGFADGGK